MGGNLSDYVKMHPRKEPISCPQFCVAQAEIHHLSGGNVPLFWWWAVLGDRNNSQAHDIHLLWVFFFSLSLWRSTLLNIAIKKFSQLSLSPTSDYEIRCRPAHGFHHVLSMTGNMSEFTRVIKRQRISGNMDTPEGGLDAMLQAAVCQVCRYRC